MATNNALNAPIPFKPSKGGTGVANSDSHTLIYNGNVSIGSSFSTTGSFTVNNTFSTGGTFSTTGNVSIGGSYTTLNSHNWIGNFAFQATLTSPTNITFPSSGTLA